MDPLTPTGLPVLLPAVHPDLSPASDDRAGDCEGDGDGGVSRGRRDGSVAARGPFKVYSPGLADWEAGIDLREGDTGLTLTTPAGHHAYATGRFTVEASPDGRIIWILGREAVTADGAGTSDWSEPAGRTAAEDRTGSPPGSSAGSADALPPVTVLMPADLSDLCSRMPGVKFADLSEAAHVIRRLTWAAAAGPQARHRFGLQRPGDLGLVVDPVDGEPVLSLLRITDGGLESRHDGRWVADDAADRIPLLTTIVPVARGAVARYDRLERSPSMSLSLFDRFTLLPDRFRTAAPQNSAGPRQLSAV